MDWDADTIMCALLTSSYTPDQDVDDFWDDVSGNEVSGTGYTTKGVALVTSAPTYDSGTNTISLDANDASWTSASFTCRYAVIWKDTATASTSPLLGYVDFGSNITVVTSTFQIVWDALGVLKGVVA